MVAALLDDTTNDRIIVLEGDLFAHAIRSDCRALSERIPFQLPRCAPVRRYSILPPRVEADGGRSVQ
jgi:hypothetical protein